MTFHRSVSLVALFVLAVTVLVATVQAQPKNVVLILSDDHRYDFFSAHPNAPDFLQTPGMDRMAREGVHLRNAFVTTSLCSPSRASILSGQYAHNHGVVDNSTPIPSGTRFFPVDLQDAGVNTAYVGKWHMGHDDDEPRPGFDRWVSFRGQGVYYNPTLNVDGERTTLEGYTTDILTDYALDFLKAQDGDAPFFLVLSHKAVHAEFEPAERHRGAYADIDIPYPPSMDLTASNYAGKPRWVREQRGSWHGVDYMYHGQLGIGASGFDNFYRRYAETLLALDESVGRVLDYLDANGLADETLVLYMGDNGFLLGEHGLIDKRNAYEESIRVPMLAWAPGWIEPGAVATDLIRNIDLAPTFLELMNVDTDIAMDGQSFLSILENATPGAADAATTGSDREFLYEYYWEHAFPHTPTTFALRGDQYKFIYYHGVWETEELYDLQNDPQEQVNLIAVPSLQPLVNQMRTRLFDRLEEEDALRVPMRRGAWQAGERWVYD